MKYIKQILLALSLLIHSACNPIYVMQAAYEQSKILIARRPLIEVIQDPETTDDEKFKLELVRQTQTFTKSMALEAGHTFTSYTQLSRDPLAWVVSGSKKDSFTPYTWWYPIVGSVPYNGYFDKEDAVCSAQKLEKQGYETWVRGTAAFSTLGWFNDPLLSSTLKLSYTELVNTVIHETVHATVWVPGSVAFNESLANYIGHRGCIEFFEDILKDSNNSSIDKKLAYRLFEKANIDMAQELEISAAYLKLFEALADLYSSDSSAEQKLIEREIILQNISSDLKNKYPDMQILNSVNNAEIMQRRLYLTKLQEFDRLFNLIGSDWNVFIDKIKLIANQAGGSDAESFAMLDKLISELAAGS